MSLINLKFKSLIHTEQGFVFPQMCPESPKDISFKRSDTDLWFRHKGYITLHGPPSTSLPADVVGCAATNGHRFVTFLYIVYAPPPSPPPHTDIFLKNTPTTTTTTKSGTYQKKLFMQCTLSAIARWIPRWIVGWLWETLICHCWLRHA